MLLHRVRARCLPRSGSTYTGTTQWSEPRKLRGTTPQQESSYRGGSKQRYLGGATRRSGLTSTRLGTTPRQGSSVHEPAATVKEYVHRRYKPYIGDASFLSPRNQTCRVLHRRRFMVPSPYTIDVHSDEVKRTMNNKVLSGAPRGCMLPELARVPLFGVDRLIQNKVSDLQDTNDDDMTEDVIRRREELCAQVESLKRLKRVAMLSHGIDVSRPATSAREATRSLYVAYLATTITGSDVSLGRIDAFLDTYIEADLARGLLTEDEAQELIDELLFNVSHAHTSLTLGGMTRDGVSLVTKTSFRFLQTLHNVGACVWPKMTVLWSTALSDGWKRFCMHTSIKTGRVQYVSDELVQEFFGDNAGVVQGASVVDIGTTKLLAGMSCNLVKPLLYSLNNGIDEISGEQVGPRDVVQVKAHENEGLEYDQVMAAFQTYVAWMAKKYAARVNIGHTQDDRSRYNAMGHALHDTDCKHLMALGTAGVDRVADILSAIRHAKVFPVKNERGLVTDFRVVQGMRPVCDRGQSQARLVVSMLNADLSRHYMYRDAKPTLAVTCDDVIRRNGNNDRHGIVTAIAYGECLGGIYSTWTGVPSVLGEDHQTRVLNGVSILDAYFGGQEGFHLHIRLHEHNAVIHTQK